MLTIEKQGLKMEWFCVDELLPEDCELCHFHKDSNMMFTSVLVMGKHGEMEIKNRIKVDRCGVPFIDEYATDGWEWGYGTTEPKYWLPIPLNKLLFDVEKER